MKKKLYLSLLIFALIAIIITSGQETNASTSSGFQVKNGVLIDSNGNSFVIRGINNPHIWYDKKAYTALDEIAKTGANTVRIVWDTTGSASRLEEIIKRCIELNMIAMPELHCATGTDDTKKIKDRARYWARDDVSAVLKKYQEYVIVNIANEPGYSRYNSTLTDEVWRDVYKECIDIMRSAGITNTIVIDTRSYGQDYLCVVKYGQDLIDYDPLHNIMFGIHMYVEWNDKNKIIDKLNLLKSRDLPILIGEFGYNYNQGNNNLHCQVDAQAVLDECERHGFGYIAWSWAGNNQENAWLDMTYDWVNYTKWGDFLVNGRNGIKQTSKICSIFEEAKQVDLRADPKSWQEAGKEITFTAEVIEGNQDNEFSFWYRVPGGNWVNAQPYSTNNTWTQSTNYVGQVEVGVLARAANSKAFEEARKIIDYRIVDIAPVEEIKLTTNPNVSQQVNEYVTFTAEVTAGNKYAEFAFYHQLPGGCWTLSRSYEQNNTWVPKTSYLGKAKVGVIARAVGSEEFEEARKIIDYEITARE